MVVVLSSLVASYWVAIFVLMGVSVRDMVGVLVLVFGSWIGLSFVGAGLGMTTSAAVRVVERWDVRLDR